MGSSLPLGGTVPADEVVQVSNSTRFPVWHLFRRERWGHGERSGGVLIAMWLFFHSYPVILLASQLLLVAALVRKDEAYLAADRGGGGGELNDSHGDRARGRSAVARGGTSSPRPMARGARSADLGKRAAPRRQCAPDHPRPRE